MDIFKLYSNSINEISNQDNIEAFKYLTGKKYNENIKKEIPNFKDKNNKIKVKKLSK